MADQEFLFPPQKGWKPLAPTRTLALDGPGARIVDNWRLGEKFLERRSAVTTNPLADNFDPSILPTFDEGVSEETERPLQIWMDPSVTGGDDPNEKPVYVLTNYRMLVYSVNGGLTFDLSPPIEGATGTIATVNAGNPVVTIATGGPGTRPWGQAVLEVNGIPIGIVNAGNIVPNTSITLVAPPIINTGGPWLLRWLGEPDGNLDQAYFRIFNNDVYVARLFQTTDIWATWGVYQITDAQQMVDAFAAPPASRFTWLAANSQMHSTEVFNNAGNPTGQPNNYIDHDASNVRVAGAADESMVRGLDLLQDGRVVVAINSENGPSRIYYSSQIQQPQIHWNESPGGFSDVISVPGALTAMGRLGDQLTLHYAHGIAIANPTGQDDPPLAFQPTRELQGCSMWRTLINVPPAAEVYLAQDGQLYLFNGSSAEPLGPETNIGLEEPQFSIGSSFLPTSAPSKLDEVFTSWDGYNRQLTLWQYNRTIGEALENFRSSTIQVTYDFTLQEFFTSSVNFNITAASRDQSFFDRSTRFELDRGEFQLVGLQNHLTSLFGRPDTYQRMLHLLSETETEEYQPPFLDEDSVPFPCVIEFDAFGVGDKTVTIDYVALEVGKRAGQPGSPSARWRVIVTYLDPTTGVVELTDEQVISPPVEQGLTYYFQAFDSNSGEKAIVRIEHLPALDEIAFPHVLGVIRVGVSALGEVRSEGQAVG